MIGDPMNDYEVYEQEVQKAVNDLLNPENQKALRNLTISKAVAEECPSPSGKSTAVGKLTQYAPLGTGFHMVPDTFQRLHAGTYEIGWVDNLPVFAPTVISTDTILKLPDSRSDELLKEIEQFWTLKREFHDGNTQAHGGFLHKRGYLLFGPPGGGKTCTIKLIMRSIIDRDGIVLLGNSRPNTMCDMLKKFRSVEPNRDIVVVLEDFDELIVQNGESSYLAMLDGEASIDGALFLASTNYPSRFEPRIYNRPGRLSDVVYIGMPNAESRRLYLILKLKDHTDVDRIVELTDGFGLDHLKSLILGVYFEKKPLEAEIKTFGITQKE
jgi:hypothetical protein